VPKATLGTAALVGAIFASCGVLSSVAPAPALFPDKTTVERFDFEQDALNQTPEGFEARLGHWSVADSPTSLSGTQVLVRGGENPALIVVKNAEQVRAAAGEVGVRVFLGPTGAGLGCDEKGSDNGHYLKLEPTAGRVGLYRKSGEELTLVDQIPLTAPKGEWARLGILCEAGRVIGYVNGKPVLRDRSGVGSFELALFADAGVTAQFDDLKYWSTK
jgi:hypothetical protein